MKIPLITGKSDYVSTHSVDHMQLFILIGIWLSHSKSGFDASSNWYMAIINSRISWYALAYIFLIYLWLTCFIAVINHTRRRVICNTIQKWENSTHLSLCTCNIQNALAIKRETDDSIGYSCYHYLPWQPNIDFNSYLRIMRA